MGKKLYTLLFSLFFLSTAAFAGESMPLNLTSGVSPISHDIYELHMTIFWICVVIGIVVFSVMLYAIIFHRKSKGAVPAQFHSHFWLEIGWTIVPVIILVLMAVPATKVLLNMYNTENEELTIKITGYQWKWHYEYLEDGISFFSNLGTPWDQIHNKGPKDDNYLREVDNVLVLPVHKKIRFLITSNDVNHAWWVPDIGVKRDAIAGYINEAWARINRAGTYYGQCAEMCGLNHAYMPIVVVAMGEEDYAAWVAKKKGGDQQAEADINKEWTMQELMQQGEKVYMRICAACHQPTGLGVPPTFPALKGSPVATGGLEKHVDTVMNGVPGTAMQAFKAQLNDIEMASVITYERNAFGNNTGTLVQPIQIKTVRDGKALADAPAPSGVTPPAPAPEPLTGTASGKPVETSPAPATPDSLAPAATPTSGTPVPPVSTQAPSASGVSAAPVAAPAAVATATKTYTLEEQMQRGEKIYLNTCAVCHQPAGTGMPPTFPALKGSPVATGPVDQHLHIVLFGKQATAMQAFKDQLTDDDLSAVVTYERNAWGNNTASVVQPADVLKARSQK